MVIVNTESFAETLDAVNDAFFHQRRLTKPNRKELARWITERRGKSGSYAGMFAPTGIDLHNGVRVYTGEIVGSGAAIGHVLGEEACRALILLGVHDSTVREALERATGGMLRRLRQTEDSGKVHGMYCCGVCSVAYWRNVMVGGLDRNEERLTAGMAALRAHRIDDGHWRRFPFYYTLLALSEMNLKSALDEMRYAAPLLERYVRKRIPDSRFSKRRRVMSERILAKC
ncbi:MAG: hypothetical protein MUO80_05655 [Dehalococcoidia bacterium]|nr:hypothetical protein [Dehalococcoidia bacterium]